MHRALKHYLLPSIYCNSAVGLYTLYCLIISIFCPSVCSLFESSLPSWPATLSPSRSFSFSVHPLSNQPLFSCPFHLCHRGFFFNRSSPVSLTFSPPLHPSPSVGTSPSSLHLFLSRALSPFCNPTFFSHRSLWIFHDLVAQRWGEKTSSIWRFHRTNIYSQDCV